MFATFFALLTDVSIYTLIKPKVGLNLAACISFLSSQVILFSILRYNQTSKINKKRHAFLIQVLIGLGTVIIHIVILNIITVITTYFDALLANQLVNNQALFNASTKILAACFGFLWTSTMIRKFIFTSKPRTY